MLVCNGSVRCIFCIVFMFCVLISVGVSLLVVVKLVEVKGISELIEDNMVEVWKVVFENVKWVVVE